MGPWAVTRVLGRSVSMKIEDGWGALYDDGIEFDGLQEP